MKDKDKTLMDNQQVPHLQPDQDSLELAQLEQQLREAQAAENFFDTASGKLTVELLTKEVTRLTRRVISDEFLKDHTGYVNAVSEIRANTNLLKRLQVAGSPVRKGKIQERLDERTNV